MKRNNYVSVRLKSNSNIYDIKSYNGMTCMYENEVNKTVEYNLLHNIINHYKYTKIQIAIDLLLYMDLWIH